MPTTPADGPAKPARARAAIRASTKDYALAALLAADEPRPPGRHSSLEEGGCIAHAGPRDKRRAGAALLWDEFDPAAAADADPEAADVGVEMRPTRIIFAVHGAWCLVLCFTSIGLAMGVSALVATSTYDPSSNPTKAGSGRSDVINGNAQASPHWVRAGAYLLELPAPPHACRSASLGPAPRGLGAPGGVCSPTPWRVSVLAWRGRQLSV